MKHLFLLLLLTLFVPWETFVVSENLVLHSNPPPSIPREIPAIAEPPAATTSPETKPRFKKAAAVPSASSTPRISKEPLAQGEPVEDHVSRIEAEVLRLSNEKRSAAGLPPLLPDAPLRKIAWAHSADMFANQYFSHENMVGCSSSCRATNAGYAWRLIGENIYMMSGYDDAPETKAQRVVDGWMNSPGHRANILGKYSVSGIGVVSAGESVYVTALYATPR